MVVRWALGAVGHGQKYHYAEQTYYLKRYSTDFTFSLTNFSLNRFTEIKIQLKVFRGNLEKVNAILQLQVDPYMQSGGIAFQIYSDEVPKNFTVEYPRFITSFNY